MNKDNKDLEQGTSYFSFLKSNKSKLENGQQPVIFSKKINNKSKIIPLNKVVNRLGPTRHFTPAAQEWFNSIYTYNKNYIKLLPTADKNLMKLVKSYFSIYIKSFRVNTLDLISKQVPLRSKRLSFRKIFVGKGDLKHTNSKVIITLYVYNYGKRFLFNEVLKFYFEKHRDIIIRFKKKNITIKKSKKFFLNLLPNVNILIHYKKILNRFYEYKYNQFILNFLRQTKWVDAKNYLSKYIANKNILSIIFSKKIEANIKHILPKLVWKKRNLFLFNINKKDILLNVNNPKKTTLKLYKSYMIKYLALSNITNNLSSDLKNKYLNFIQKACDKKTVEILLHNYVLQFNNRKFKQPFLNHLTTLVKRLYNKEVLFNIVKLNKLHLNSDIYTEAVALRLKKRENRLYKVLRWSLSKFKIGNAEKKILSLRNNPELLINKTRNMKINSLANLLTTKDPLNILLLKLYSNSKKIAKKNLLKGYDHYLDYYLSNFVLESLTHNRMGGLRIEAKGRLTKRFTASRSVFKARWKGGLKNFNSSFEGLPSIMLRGHVSSNLQYTVVNSKTRNGAFGLKGWVSGK
jgi:hypothetical protein